MPKAYVVIHSMLGNAGHVAGEVVEFTDDQINKVGIDVERLLTAGAIREATPEEAEKARTYGNSGTNEVNPFPAVPYAPTAPEETTPVGEDVSDKPQKSAKA